MNVKNFMAKELKQTFHRRHEAYTRCAYFFPFLPPDRHVFVLTNQCNLRCSSCFQKKNYDPGKAMIKEEWIKLSKQIPHFARITLTGGEPLLFFGFKEVLQEVAAQHQCNVITNGVLLSEEVVDAMLSLPNFKVLALSIDSIRKDFLNARGIRDDDWERLIHVVEYFIRKREEKKSHCILEIKTLILDENTADLFQIHKYCMEQLKTDHHTFQFLKGSALQHSDQICKLEEIFKKSRAPAYRDFGLIMSELEKVKQYNLEKKTVAFLHPKFADLNMSKPFPDVGFINHKEFNKNLFKPCKFPWSSVHINYDGEVFPCLAVSLGNVKQKPLKDILKGIEHKEFLNIIKRNGTVEACNRCGWLKVR